MTTFASTTPTGQHAVSFHQDPAYRLASSLISTYGQWRDADTVAIAKGTDPGKSSRVQTARHKHLGACRAVAAFVDTTENHVHTAVVEAAGQFVQVPSEFDSTGRAHWYVQSAKRVAEYINREF